MSDILCHVVDVGPWERIRAPMDQRLLHDFFLGDTFETFKTFKTMNIFGTNCNEKPLTDFNMVQYNSLRIQRMQLKLIVLPALWK
ncbi:hypothetical protein KDH_08020 [Dictyobacter sp. S3.2.2.5]|uniref:Uncharacterized protein n=1 Tax=Dictyobacter halimunensis TaxID=3026934 RepID=A0ABQ6FN48_9CHLR|nr:hypothetical protein KDH_08020 [Dictyobacter sp. S3.2.2.5]